MSATACAGCGTPAPDELPLTWSTSIEAGRELAFCPSCTRDNIRAIEGKLDSAWW